MKHIVVIGGGIAGLSAAWAIQQSGKPARLTILEADSRWGGKISTRQLDFAGVQCVVDGGPESFVTRKPEVWDLAHQLGLGDQLVNPGSETRNIFVLDGGVPKQVPLSPGLFVSSNLLSWKGKLRLLTEPFQPARRDAGDESLGDFASRRLGREASEKMIGPILGGIYNTDPRLQSILVSSPVMREMEREGGSLIGGSLKRAFKPRPKTKDGKRRPAFITFSHGVQPLVDALCGQLQGDLRLNTPVESVEPIAKGWRIILKDGSVLEADAIVVATLANVAAKLLKQAAPVASQMLTGIQHSHIGTMSLVYHQKDIPAKPLVNGLMIPRREKRAVDAVTFTSRKMPSRVSPGYELVRVFMGGAKPEILENQSDDALAQTVCGELKTLLGIKAEPVGYTVFRWLEGYPQAHVGHMERVDILEKSLPAGIALAGSSYRGVAVPDCIRQAREAALRVLSCDGRE